MNYKEIHIGSLIKQRMLELDVTMDRILNYFKVDEVNILQMFESDSLDSSIILMWCKILDYDFFRIYTQHLIYYSPMPVFTKNKIVSSQVPQFRKNLYSKEVIDFIMEKVNSGQMSKVDVMKRYGVPKSTLYRWFAKYESK